MWKFVSFHNRLLLYSSIVALIFDDVRFFASAESVTTIVPSIFNITRVYNSGDLFQTYAYGNCSTASFCERFKAYGNPEYPCQCRCYEHAPVFQQHVQRCTDTIKDCQLIEFQSGAPFRRVPAVFLPLTTQIIYSSHPIDWTSAGITQEDGVPLDCQVRSAGYLTDEGWKDIAEKSIFSLTLLSGKTNLQWMGDKHAQEQLAGKLVLVNVHCHNHSSPLCVSFRVVGRDTAYAVTTMTGGGSAQTSKDSLQANQIGLIVGIVCATLLVMSVAAFVLCWTLCWRHQKRRMAQKLQMQMYFEHQISNHHPQLEYDRPTMLSGMVSGPYSRESFDPVDESYVPSVLEAYQYANGEAYHLVQQSPHANMRFHEGFNGGGRHSPIGRSFDDQMSPPNPPHQLQYQQMMMPSQQQMMPVRKKLYFSPEFFEPDLMADPPPIAEEFLSEVRRMIDIAKNRIRSRRYIPSLLVIPEDDSSRGSTSRESLHSAGGRQQHTLDVRGGLKAKHDFADLSSPIWETVDEGSSSPHSSSEDSSSPGAECNTASDDSGAGKTDSPSTLSEARNSALSATTADSGVESGRAPSTTQTLVQSDSSSSQTIKGSSGPTLITHEKWLQQQAKGAANLLPPASISHKVSSWLEGNSVADDDDSPPPIRSAYGWNALQASAYEFPCDGIPEPPKDYDDDDDVEPRFSFAPKQRVPLPMIQNNTLRRYGVDDFHLGLATRSFENGLNDFAVPSTTKRRVPIFYGSLPRRRVHHSPMSDGRASLHRSRNGRRTPPFPPYANSLPHRLHATTALASPVNRRRQQLQRQANPQPRPPIFAMSSPHSGELEDFRV